MQILRLQLKLRQREKPRGKRRRCALFTQSPPPAVSQPAALPYIYFHSVSLQLPKQLLSSCFLSLLVSFKMASGVKVSDEVKTLLKEMQVNRKEDDPQERIRIAELSIENGEIVVKQIHKEKDLKDVENVYKHLQSLMREEECEYIVYDCHYEVCDTKKEDMVFIMWSCDKAKTKLKMPYASSKSCIRKIAGAKHEFEFHAMEEITPQCFADCIARIAKAQPQKLEGKDVNSC